MNPPLEVLLAEDDETDVLLMRRAFQDVGMLHTLQVVRHGREAMDFLGLRLEGEQDRLPALVILDIKMPLRSGLDVLRWMRGQPVLRCVPVMMFSSSAHRDDIEQAYALGANVFIIKPASMARRREVAQFIDAWLKLGQPPLAVTEGCRAAQSLHAGSDWGTIK